MTTIAEAGAAVTGGVDTHSDVHVAAVVTAVGGVLGTEQFPTTAAGYRRLLGWMRTFGQLDRVGVEGTGTYGVALARHLRAEQVTVVEVMRPNRQVRRRHGKTDVVDAIAAARAVLSGEANATPKTHDGPVEALRTLKVLQRSATKARTQALNQLRALLVTASDELRARLRDLSQRELLATCAAFRVNTDDDSLAAVTRFALRELAQRALFLAERLEQVKLRLKRITEQIAPPDRPQGRRPGRRLDVASRRRRQPSATGQRALVRLALRRQPCPGQQRQDPSSPAQPRRRPPGQRGPVAHRAGPSQLRPTHQGLPRQARHGRQK